MLSLLIALVFSFNTSAVGMNDKSNRRIDLLQSYLWVEYSGEYVALCKQAYTIARLRIEQELLKKKKKMAVILDLDETVISNILFFKKLNKQPKLSWMTWVNKEEAFLIPGALEFLIFLKKNNVKILYITNRPISIKRATLSNLSKLKIPFNKDEVLFKQGKIDSKESRREHFLKKYNVVLYLGDNLGDFSSKYDHKVVRRDKSFKEMQFGNKYIVFPNPLYGGWEKAIFKKNIYNFKKRVKFLENLEVL